MRSKHILIIWLGLCLCLSPLTAFAQGDAPGYANFCPDFPVGGRPSRLVGGMPARVSDQVPSMNVREDALITARVVAQLAAGTVVWTTSAPACNDGYIWWQVAFKRNGTTEFGWAAEATATTYLLEPLTPEMNGLVQQPTFSAQSLGLITEVGAINDLGGVRDINWSPDDQQFAVSTVGATWIYDIANLSLPPKRLKSNGVQTHDITRSDFNPDGSLIALYGPTLEVWRVNPGQPEFIQTARVANILSGKLAASDLSTDWSYYASSPGDEITIWEAGTAEPIRVLSGHSLVGSLLFSPDTRTLVSGGAGGMMVSDTTLRFWDVETGEQRAVVDGFMGMPKLVFTPDSETLIAQLSVEGPGGFTPGLYPINVETGALGAPFELPPGGQMVDFTLSGDGRLLAIATINYDDASAGLNTILTFFDMEKQKPVNSYAVAGEITRLAFNNTGSTLALVQGQVFPSPVNPIIFLGVNG